MGTLLREVPMLRPKASKRSGDVSPSLGFVLVAKELCRVDGRSVQKRFQYRCPTNDERILLYPLVLLANLQLVFVELFLGLTKDRKIDVHEKLNIRIGGSRSVLRRRDEICH